MLASFERQSISFFEASFHFCARKLDAFIMNEKNFLPDRTARATRRTPPCRPTRAPRRSPGWQSGCYKERRGAKSWPRKRPRQRSARHRGLPLQAGARVKAFTNNLQEFEHVDKTKTDNHDTWNVGANGPGLRRQTTVAWPAVHSTLEGLDLRICRCTSQWDMPEMAKTMNISCIYISKIVCRPSQKLLKCNTQTEKDLYSTQSSSNSL